MYRAPSARALASAWVQPATKTLAPPCLLLGQRWKPPVRQSQHLRTIATPLGATMLGGAVIVAAATAPLLAVRLLRQKRIGNDLKGTLDQARSLQASERRRIFFDVARRFAANNGSDVEFKESGLTFKIPKPTTTCNVTAFGSHNVQYSIHKRKLLKWKIWVAVDAELAPHRGSESSSPSPEPTETDKDDTLSVSVKQALDEPLVYAVVGLVLRIFDGLRGPADAGKAVNGEAKPIQVPEDVELEMLVWDTVIPLKLNIRTGNFSMRWVGKINERRPWENSWFIIPIPFFFDF